MHDGFTRLGPSYTVTLLLWNNCGSFFSFGAPRVCAFSVKGQQALSTKLAIRTAPMLRVSRMHGPRQCLFNGTLSICHRHDLCLGFHLDFWNYCAHREKLLSKGCPTSDGMRILMAVESACHPVAPPCTVIVIQKPKRPRPLILEIRRAKSNRLEHTGSMKSTRLQSLFAMTLFEQWHPDSVAQPAVGIPRSIFEDIFLENHRASLPRRLAQAINRTYASLSVRNLFTFEPASACALLTRCRFRQVMTCSSQDKQTYFLQLLHNSKPARDSDHASLTPERDIGIDMDRYKVGGPLCILIDSFGSIGKLISTATAPRRLMHLRAVFPYPRLCTITIVVPGAKDALANFPRITMVPTSGQSKIRVHSVILASGGCTVDSYLRDSFEPVPELLGPAKPSAQIVSVFECVLITQEGYFVSFFCVESRQIFGRRSAMCVAELYRYSAASLQRSSLTSGSHPSLTAINARATALIHGPPATNVKGGMAHDKQPQQHQQPNTPSKANTAVIPITDMQLSDTAGR
ncbi:uncharacterized protein LAESUDRAFT_713359 [Laetiporus sulphureus 93-53]|uniref:Uncharacterized protein n=1 Tax=Laetiporus sulphureus 93-53 TaxID=1314785 RepID=A0A165ERU4_9APHY|nr:uncharacterized protein LAESUDRAFT_713359 [Laetiporus sulphureus 93-53]KZT07636.1 hypothetical protein LAESUDRAFT_713359 [Laetiporus sulphureus 93-53]